MDLYSIGEMVVDFLPGKEPGSFTMNPGGAPANVAIAAARNGLEAGVCCKVGDDDFGRFLTGVLKKEGVEILCREACREAVTTMTFVTLSEGGERRFTFAQNPGADKLLSPDDVGEEDIREAVIVHAGSCSMSMEPSGAATVKALQTGHRLGKLVSFDINYRNLLWNDDKAGCARAVDGILPLVDVLKISEEEADMVGGIAAIPDLMNEKGLTAVVLTLGGDGAEAFYAGRLVKVPGRKTEAVDATGAGDAFWGGFLSRLIILGVKKASDITEDIMRDALYYGNISGSLCIQKKGAISSLPGRTEIEKILARESNAGVGKVQCAAAGTCF